MVVVVVVVVYSNIYHYYIHGPQGNVDRSEPSRIQVCMFSIFMCFLHILHMHEIITSWWSYAAAYNQSINYIYKYTIPQQPDWAFNRVSSPSRHEMMSTNIRLSTYTSRLEHSVCWSPSQVLVVCKRVSWTSRLSQDTAAVKGDAHYWIFAEELKNFT